MGWSNIDGLVKYRIEGDGLLNTLWPCLLAVVFSEVRHIKNVPAGLCFSSLGCSARKRSARCSGRPVLTFRGCSKAALFPFHPPEFMDRLGRKKEMIEARADMSIMNMNAFIL